ncbi:hypothetical protein IKU74_06790 [bacterium]|nr:hypothetical protein [bacterium]
MNESDEKIIKYANLCGYDYALYAGGWNNYIVYDPIFWDSEPRYIGKPHSILYNDSTGEIRLTNDDECFEVLRELGEDERILENEPIELEPNLTIKSFEFIRGGYPYVPYVYKYKSTKKHGKILEYNNREFERMESIAISIEDEVISLKPPLKISITDENFDEYALGMIKYFHEDFGVNPNVRDGEWYEFKATLSNGQKIKSRGYNWFPATYIKFIAYLDHIFTMR